MRGHHLHPGPYASTGDLDERVYEQAGADPDQMVADVTASRGDTVTLAVESSGPPITADQAASLFEPFRRLHADRVGSARGSGLGLSIVRAVARARGGDATAVPVAGGGLRVTVTLPAAPATAATGRPSTIRQGAPSPA